MITDKDEARLFTRMYLSGRLIKAYGITDDDIEAALVATNWDAGKAFSLIMRWYQTI